MFVSVHRFKSNCSDLSKERFVKVLNCMHPVIGARIKLKSSVGLSVPWRLSELVPQLMAPSALG
eukprot:6033216-Amphidinium_carterae.1